MSVIEIVLIIIGALLFLLGYLLPARKKDLDEEVQLISEDEIKKLIAKEVDGVKEQISSIVDETIEYSMEKAERSMEKVSNDKIMAVGEYSDTVLEQINKNHKEVVFLYDMLNDKHDNLVTTINKVTQTADEIKQNVRDAEITADEAVKKVKDAQTEAKVVLDRIMMAEHSVMEAQENVENAMKTVISAVENSDVNLARIHDGREYREDIVEEVQQAFDEEDTDKTDVIDRMGGKETGADISAMHEMYDMHDIDASDNTEEPQEDASAADPEGAEEPAFTPISPRRVKIIHEPDGDYVDEPIENDISASEAFAQMGIFGKMDAPKDVPKDVPKTDAPNVDIHFAQDKDNGRNSNERILELHKAGKSNMAIAKELGLGIGEVKLVIDLFEGM